MHVLRTGKVVLLTLSDECVTAVSHRCDKHHDEDELDPDAFESVEEEPEFGAGAVFPASSAASRAGSSVASCVASSLGP
jgi:hypothetical protein